jgi:transposase-like protein
MRFYWIYHRIIKAAKQPMSASAETILQYFERHGLNINCEYLREALAILARNLMEVEVSRIIDASHYERNQRRVAYRNGYRRRMWKTSLGAISIEIPKLRRGTYTPSFLNMTTSQKLLNFAKSGYISPIRISEIERLLTNLGFEAIRRNEALKIFDDLDTLVERHRQDTIDESYAYVWIETIELKDEPRKQFAAFAVGVTESGDSTLLAMETGQDKHDAAFWRQFIQILAKRSSSFRMIISDDYSGLSDAVYTSLKKVYWQYLRASQLETHFERIANNNQTSIVDAISALLIPMRQRINNRPFIRSDVANALMRINHSSLSYLDMPLFDTATLEILTRLKTALTNQADAIGIESDDLNIELFAVPESSPARTLILPHAIRLN